MNLNTEIKKILRPIYYLFNNGKTVNVEGYNHLSQYKWLVNKDYGMAYYKGYYEPQLCKYLNENLNVNSVFADVGSHAGYFSLFASGIVKKGYVYSFEPAPNNFNFIKKIKQLNNIENWSIINKAVGDKKGVLNFNSNTSSSTGKIDQNGTLKVDVTTLDIELANINKLDVVKIDVEGFGGQVIIGAMDTIAKLKPKLMIEIHSGTEELAIILSHLDTLYNFYDLDTGTTVTHKDQPVSFIIGTPVN